MDVLEKQYAIMSSVNMGESRDFMDYKHMLEFPHGGVCYNWNAAGDLKNYIGTTEQWVAIQSAIEEIKNYGTIIFATYLSANDETVQLKLKGTDAIYFIAPDASINTISVDGMYVEDSGGNAAKQILAGLYRKSVDIKYNDCNKKDVLPGAVNYNWDKAGLLKDYDGTTWYALDAAKTDMSENGTVYLATYDDTTLVALQIDNDGLLYYVTPAGLTIILKDPSVTEESSSEAIATTVVTEDISTEDNSILVSGYSRIDYPYIYDLGVSVGLHPTVVTISGTTYESPVAITLALDDSDNWDDTTYATASNRLGMDFYIYACEPTLGTVPIYKFSANSTTPVGYTAINSRKIGGFHCECADIPDTTTWIVDYTGATGPHKLAGLKGGYIIPASIWDLYHRPVADTAGMLWCSDVSVWVDIYLAGWDGVKLVSQFGAATADGAYPTINPVFGNAGLDNESFHILARSVNKRCPSRIEYLAFAEGSNERTAIEGAKDWGDTGGHKDTAGKRMVSNVGCEDCCGYLWQWTTDFGSNGYGSDFHSGYTYSGNNYNVNGRGYAYGGTHGFCCGGGYVDTNQPGSCSVALCRASAYRNGIHGGRLVCTNIFTIRK